MSGLKRKIGPRLLPAVCSFAVVLCLAATGPKIHFEQTSHDFGELRSDETASYDWVFTNTGDEPLEILRTRSSCGCTMSVAQEEPVPPGGSGTIHVEFDAGGLEGSIKRTLAVESNDPQDGLILLKIRANVTSVAVPTVSGGHPRIGGQSLLMGECASCHAAPASGKTGAELYAAVCAMCHGPRAAGERAPSLRHPSYLDEREDRELAEGIAYGTTNPRMPGYSELMGGPLNDEQIDSLVRLLREWGSTTEKNDGATSHDGG